MNGNFDNTPKDDTSNRSAEEESNPIRRGYTDAPEEQAAPSASETPLSEEEKKEYRFKAEAPAGAPAGDKSYYFDYTRVAPETNGAPHQYQYQSSYIPEDSDKRNKYATASLILGIIGIVMLFMCCCLSLFVPLGLGIAGIVCAVKSRSPLTRKFPERGTVGLVLSIISLVLGTLSFFGSILYFIFVVMIVAEESTNDMLGGEVYIAITELVRYVASV